MTQITVGSVASPSSWREKARPIIAAVLRETEGQDEKTIRRALRDAYPFGERAMYPYKAWQAEVTSQRGVVRMTALRRRQLAAIEAHNQSLFMEQEDRPATHREGRQ